MRGRSAHRLNFLGGRRFRGRGLKHFSSAANRRCGARHDLPRYLSKHACFFMRSPVIPQYVSGLKLLHRAAAFERRLDALTGKHSPTNLFGERPIARRSTFRITVTVIVPRRRVLAAFLGIPARRSDPSLGRAGPAQSPLPTTTNRLVRFVRARF